MCKEQTGQRTINSRRKSAIYEPLSRAFPYFTVPMVTEPENKGVPS